MFCALFFHCLLYSTYPSPFLLAFLHPQHVIFVNYPPRAFSRTMSFHFPIPVFVFPTLHFSWKMCHFNFPISARFFLQYGQCVFRYCPIMYICEVSPYWFYSGMCGHSEHFHTLFPFSTIGAILPKYISMFPRFSPGISFRPFSFSWFSAISAHLSSLISCGLFWASLF